MIYLDSNVFIYAATAAGAVGDRAKGHLVRALQAGACTSSLTVDEVLWSLKKAFGRAVATDRARDLLALDLTILAVDQRDAESAVDLFETGMDPRDAIHAAVAKRHACTSIVSSDGDFAKAGLKHVRY